MAKHTTIAAVNISGIHSVLTVYGVVYPNNRDLIRTGEGLTSIVDFGVFDGDHDVADIAKSLSSRTSNDGHVNLGMVHIKELQALVYWINDHQKFGQDLNPYEFNQEIMLSAMQLKRIEKDQLSSDVDSTTLDQFDPDNFETHEDSFMNMVS